MELTPETRIYLNKFKPREYQKCIFDAIRNKDYKRIMAIWPRRAGKDVTAWNLCIKELLTKVQTIYYVFPTYSSGRRILWDAISNDSFRILNYLPKEVIESKNEQMMRIKLKNGSVFQVIGSDNYDNALVGTNPKGVVFSEFAISNPLAYSFVRPILTVNGGWALIITTPRGKNFLWEMYNVALSHPNEWFVSKLTVDDTKHVSMKEILRERELGDMSEDLQMQEYWTSFDMGVEGAYYTKYLDRMRLNGQIGIVPWEPNIKVHTAWDIGVRDSTVIIFFQVCNQVIRIIDCYDNSKEGLEHYVNVLNSKDYTYGTHIGPHDIRNMEFSTGVTRWEKARDLGVTFEVADKLAIMDGIEAVRSKLSRMWLDERNCAALIKALNNYRQEYDAKKKVYKMKPLHDNSSHFADAMRYLAVSLHKVADEATAEELEDNYRKARYGSNVAPNFFSEQTFHF